MKDKKIIIDVSEHNGKLDWKKLKQHIDGVIIRIGYGDNLTSQDDKYASYNISECNRYNIPYGLYLYSYADNHTHLVSEYEHITRMIELYNAHPTLPIFLDMEENKLANKSNNLAIEFLAMCKKLPYKVGIYSSAFWWKNFLTSKMLDNGFKWVAQYYTQCEVNNPYMWQFTNEYKIENQLFDASYLYANIEYVDTDIVLKNVSRETLNEWNTKYVELAKDIINNKYGTGIERKNKILEMGYDYNMVQSFVNEMI